MFWKRGGKSVILRTGSKLCTSGLPLSALMNKIGLEGKLFVRTPAVVWGAQPWLWLFDHQVIGASEGSDS